ncbi:MAG: TIGR00730 family Rossman fold protein [Desulfuromonadales bacterium]|nr:TIGR00730 family Rossman fold protein [Desulfuromonadales bacterium]
MEKPKYGPFPSTKDVVCASELCVKSPQTESSSFRLAYLDPQFMLDDDLRPVRLQLELLKAELIQQAAGIQSTVVVFGSARTLEPEVARQHYQQACRALDAAPDDPRARQADQRARKVLEHSGYYEEARRFAHLLSNQAACHEPGHFVVVTGGGPGIMEAANRGADEAGAKSIGLNIVLPMEQAPNRYITPELCFQFHYFAIRKMHFLLRAKALVAFPGGFGTLDELFDALTLVQTRKVKRIPVLLFGKAFWQRIVNFEALAEEGMISAEDLELICYVETAEEAYREIRQFYAGEFGDQ